MFKTAPRIFKHVAFDILAALSPAPQARLVVVTSRHVGNAVQRNKIRRRLKALFTKYEVASLGKDLIIVTKKSSTSLPFDKIEQLFEQMLVALQKKKEAFAGK